MSFKAVTLVENVVTVRKVVVMVGGEEAGWVVQANIQWASRLEGRTSAVVSVPRCRHGSLVGSCEGKAVFVPESPQRSTYAKYGYGSFRRLHASTSRTCGVFEYRFSAVQKRRDAWAPSSTVVKPTSINGPLGHQAGHA